MLGPVCCCCGPWALLINNIICSTDNFSFQIFNHFWWNQDVEVIYSALKSLYDMPQYLGTQMFKRCRINWSQTWQVWNIKYFLWVTGPDIKTNFGVTFLLYTAIIHSDLLTMVTCSVTRLDDLLHFRQLFKPFGNNKFAQIFHILRQFL